MFASFCQHILSSQLFPICQPTHPHHKKHHIRIFSHLDNSLAPIMSGYNNQGGYGQSYPQQPQYGQPQGYAPQQSYSDPNQYPQQPQQGYGAQEFGPPRRQDSYGPPSQGGFQHGQAGGTYGTYDASNPQGHAGYYGGYPETAQQQQYGQQPQYGQGQTDAFAANQAYQNQLASGGAPSQAQAADHQFAAQSTDPQAPNYVCINRNLYSQAPANINRTPMPLQ